MHGKPTFEKKMRTLRAKAARRPPTAASSQQLQVGSWIFEEDQQGNLTIRHLDSEESTIFFPKP